MASSPPTTKKNTLTGQQRKSSLLWDYLTTVDHKKIAILYMIAGDHCRAVHRHNFIKLLRTHKIVPRPQELNPDKHGLKWTAKKKLFALGLFDDG
jgi:hypothetical protein